MKPLNCSEVDELLGAYVLTALPDEEIVAVDAHLSQCFGHRVVGKLQLAASTLTLAGPFRDPPAALRARTIDAIRLEAVAPGVALGWSDETLPLGSHACFYHSDDQTLKRTMAFLRVGLDNRKDFGVILADQGRHDALLAWLQEGYSGSVKSLIDRRKLALIDGNPDPEHLLRRIGHRLEQAMREGYSVIRLLGFIGWGRPGWPDTDSLIEFENRINQVVGVYPAVVICTYDVPRLDGRIVIDGGLRKHPITILAKQIVRANPFYLAA